MGNVNMEASQINYRGGQKKMSVEEALKNTSGELDTLKSGLTEVNSNLNGLLKSGLFSVLCTSGVNILERGTTTLIGGSFPASSFNRCVFMISNHATTQDAPNTIEVDGADTLIINAVSGQGLTVSWLDFSNVQTS